MTCKCETKLPPRDDECLICRRPVEREEDGPIIQAANHASNALTALDDPLGVGIEPDDVEERIRFAIVEINEAINLLTPAEDEDRYASVRRG